jgi:hypothetical protein
MGFSGEIEVKVVYESEKVSNKGVFKPRLRAHAGQIHASLRKRRNRLLRKQALAAEAAAIGISVQELITKRAQEAEKVVPKTEKERIASLASNFGRSPRDRYGDRY